MKAKAKAKARPEIYDYSEGDEDSIVMIVRPNNTYGEARAGEKVRVSEDESQNPSTKSCLMTEKEQEEIAAEKLRRAKLKAKKVDRSIKAMVEAGLSKLPPRQPRG